MIPIQEIPEAVCKNLRGIFCDIDDTLTEKGKLPACSYAALWAAYDAGLRVVPVTGRPAGWVDHFARMWPVTAVIGENGAFYFWMQDNKMKRHFLQTREERLHYRAKLQEIERQVLASVPGAAVSADQAYRESDLAIDFCEDVKALPRSEILKIVEIFQAQGAKAKISSIHVNGWFGDFDKLTTCRLLLQNLWGEESESSLGSYLFCGDSPNDEPMFAAFPHAVGVANILPWLSLLKHPPKYQTQATGGEGFAEMVNILLGKRCH